MSNTSSKPQIKLLPFHPLADLFPLLQGKDFEDLVRDIEQNTQRQDIDIYDGKIIDGRNRARACQKLGMEPRYHERRFDSEADIAAFIISQNINRRHLTAEQKRDMILRCADWSKSDRAIAAEMKSNKNTVARLRKKVEEQETVPPGTVQKRIGKDSKARKQPTIKLKPNQTPELRPVAKSESNVSPGSTFSEKLEVRVIALADFAKFTIENIRAEKLKLSGDVKVMSAWRDVRERIEPFIK
jgi:hypothetical protein